MQDQGTYDLAVIGAGIYGIQAARTYLSIHPHDKVIVFEEVGKLAVSGQVQERVYDSFWTQTPLRILEFSDMPLEGVPETETYHGFFRATHVAEYLKLYVETRIYGGKSLVSRIHFYSKAQKLVKLDDGWTIDVQQTRDEQATSSYLARKVIDATGLTSTPNIPNIEGQDCFKGRIFHHIDFARHQDDFKGSQKPQSVAVIGGAKSAADVAYTCAKAGHKVHWIIRRNGAGPAAFVSPEASWPYKNSNESFYTRITSHFLASWFFDDSSTWLGRLLYKTSGGQAMIRTAWQAINRKVLRFADYDRPDGRENGFHNLRPDTEIFWQNDSTGICQRPDFFDTIARSAEVHREDIKCMIPTGIELADSTIVEVDYIVFATGWVTSHPKIQQGNEEEDIRVALGLSSRYSHHDLARRKQWRKAEIDAEKVVLARFPFLQDRPAYHKATSIDYKAPLRLYKGVLPIKDHTIAFVGQFLSGNNFRISEVQALYAVAALDGTLPLPTTEEMQKAVAQTIAWNRLRYLGKGTHGSWLYWDMVPYTDNLLKELGLRSHLHGSWWTNLFAPCFASDLIGLIDEYRSKRTLGEETGVPADAKK